MSSDIAVLMCWRPTWLPSAARRRSRWRAERPHFSYRIYEFFLDWLNGAALMEGPRHSGGNRYAVRNAADRLRGWRVACHLLARYVSFGGNLIDHLLALQKRLGLIQ